MFLFNKEDVYIGYSLEELSKVREILEKEGIKYIYKVINHSDTSKSILGSFGTKMDYEKQYIVSVKKNDYEKAKYLTNSVLHP
ncbi:hypothetical protein [Clostridium sp. HMP27]|uniref:hypothetical protein n=1 Tax=Clostridium sp. HMP27 TaxID=1487921 RepID=UPI00052BE18C|nr:hypothetical protein [Clostridium sp. HMP27]KGK84825.1 hypothetical protein DP68_16310 [Clostridium sp. HMP27]